jgi:L-iditol 2-dehydrogenase
MKVVRFHAPGDVRIEEIPEPEPGAGEVKIRVRNCSTCGTDVKIFKFGHHHIVPPRVMGHEIAGEVVGTGDGVTGWTPGDRVQVIAAIPCGRCTECARGRMTVCPNQESMGYHYDGGFAEYTVVPAKVLAVDGLNRIPPGVGFASASVAEPLACVLNGQELARVGTGDDVVVIGAGPIGCLHVRLARARGAARVVLADVNADRLAAAAAIVAPDATVCSSPWPPAGEAERSPRSSGRNRQASVDPVDEVLKLTDGRGADVVIIAAAAGKAQEQGLQMAARQGRVSFFGGLPKDNPVIACDANLVHYRELTIVGANGSSPAHNKQALRLIASGAVPVGDLITHRLPLDRALDAFGIVAAGEAIKVTIEP